MRKIAALIIFLVVLSIFPALSAAQNLQDNKPEIIKVSHALKMAKIAFIEPLPLPFEIPSGQASHDRVFTGEFRSDMPEDSKIFGWFVPNDYEEMINKNVMAAASVYGLNIEIIKDINEIPDNADFIIMSAVQHYTCGEEAFVSIKVRLHAGKERDFEMLKTEIVTRSVSAEKIPMIVNEPVHMTGDHANNFHPQRTLLNFAAYNCVLDIIKLVGREVR